jgi:flagellar basal-body rod protein FlgF
MENTSYIALSQMSALRRQMDVIANNLANVSTPSFRGERVIFRELVADRTGMTSMPGQGSRASFMTEQGTLRDLRAGAMERTGNSLDVGLVGPGYFVLQGEDAPRYTRHGSFHPDPQGRLVNNDGVAVLGEGDQPISLPPGETKIEIDRRGVISGKDGVIGRLRVVRFEDEQALRKVGDNTYEAEADPQPVDDKTQVAQGMIEGSNVQGVIEITQMIELLRRYQTANRLMEQEHERARRAIDKLTRVG